MHSSQPSPDAFTHLSSIELVLTWLSCNETFPDSIVPRQLPTPIPSSAPTSLPTSSPTPVNMPPLLDKATPESRLILRSVICVCFGLSLFFLSFLQVPTSVPTPQPTPVPTLKPTPLPTLAPTPLPSLVNYSCERARLVDFIQQPIIPKSATFACLCTQVNHLLTLKISSHRLNLSSLGLIVIELFPTLLFFASFRRRFPAALRLPCPRHLRRR